MKLTALKRFHASDIKGPEGRRTVDPGEEFEAPDETGQQLLDRQLAEMSGGSAEPQPEPEQKAEPDLLNKAEPTPKKKRKSAAAEPEETEE